MRCVCGSNMEYLVKEAATKGRFLHVYKCINCRREKICNSHNENEEVRINAKAGKKVAKWF